VSGEIEQQEIVALSPVIEAGNRLADRRGALVQQGDDLVELPDRRRLQDLLEPMGVEIGSPQAAQTRVVVVAAADDERELASHVIACCGSGRVNAPTCCLSCRESGRRAGPGTSHTAIAAAVYRPALFE
jgi:hypothetical protein